MQYSDTAWNAFNDSNTSDLLSEKVVPSWHYGTGTNLHVVNTSPIVTQQLIKYYLNYYQFMLFPQRVFANRFDAPNKSIHVGL